MHTVATRCTQAYDEIDQAADLAKLRIDKLYHEACLTAALEAIFEGGQPATGKLAHHQNELAKIDAALSVLSVKTGKPRAAKIYIKRGETLHSFMWADVSSDGSVMLGFTFAGTEEVEVVFDEVAEMRKPTVVTTENVGQSKISFHASGQYKLTAKMGKSAGEMDRATVEGPALRDISEPRRMAELLLPKSLPTTAKTPTDLDIVLDASSAPEQPMRCTISCMSKVHFAKAISSEAKFVDTSIWEFVHALETGDQVWVWTLRASRNDEKYPDRIGVMLLGPVKWAKPHGPEPK